MKMDDHLPELSMPSGSVLFIRFFDVFTRVGIVIPVHMLRDFYNAMRQYITDCREDV